jgi:hypothetical protein
MGPSGSFEQSHQMWSSIEKLKMEKWGQTMASHAQSTMIDKTGMKFLTLCKVTGLFIFVVPLLLTVWRGFWLIITVFLRVITIANYGGYRIWMFAVHGEHCSSYPCVPFQLD